MADEIEQPVTEPVAAPAPEPAPEPAPVVEEKPKSVRDTIIAAKAEVEARARDEQGRFAKPADKPVSPEPAAAPQVAAPPAWTKHLKHVKWDQIPTAVRKHFEAETGLTTLAEFHDKAKPDADFAQAVRQRLQPFADQYRQRGMNELQAIEFLAGLQNFATRDPVNYLRHAAQSLGVDLRQLIPTAPNQAQPQQNADPRVTRLEQTLTAMLNNQAQATEAQYLGQINKFRESKNQDGTPKYPHFDELRAAIASNLRSSQSEMTLEQAYEAAVWARPDLREKLIAEQFKAQEAKRAETNAKAAADARRAASPPRGAPGGPGQLPKGASVRDSIRHAIQLHS